MIFAEIKETINPTAVGSQFKKKKKKMNPNVTLDELALGVSSCERVQPLDPTVIAALTAAVTTQRTVNTIGAPVKALTIDNTQLGGGTQNQIEFTFTNDTAVTITYWFTGLFTDAGDAVAFGIAGNAARDFPAAHGTGNPSGVGGTENGGAKLYVFNKKASVIGYLIEMVEVTTSNTGNQKTQNLIVITDNFEDTPCTSKRLAPICDGCNNNSNSDTFTARFRCPLAVGGNMSFGYPVLSDESVTIRLNGLAEGVAQYKSLSGGCGC